mmetsp:Transcript_58956/g.104771  ORF Transcript_58956/g.104771 Transcript_58956/m.104771 type:complete len:1172 (+) Transcript_58956:46-3561(+)|eukprot:CAMPEP_0197632868 /NCGR_PEP_ID=MMETSP1338-20131121/9406_1 /TAXON_ID=43686 ORGANISM="Pelagodinium beii, Strain RCC1491" /NCGR_SAMPLE_ID=MMETSP1338 /ASSEMBLY_ACC=CAM_ASM_000754 /LENGTH=1171 /DNA_ID=CAMNT_0043204441 /DNA_START=27 /DNA_END=3542 /DNA_ORIENTATION=-
MAGDRAPRRRLQVLKDHVVHHTGAGASIATAGTASSNPPFRKIFIANRGEIACRIHRAAKALGMETVGVFTKEDADSLHPKVLDKVIELSPGATPVAPYLDAASISDIAAREGCTAVHPGYGFLSENEEFASLCEKKGIKFVGPNSKLIDLFGDKTKAKEAAQKAKIPVLVGSPGLKSVEEAAAYLKANPMKFPLLLKASFGGGGRGQSVVQSEADFPKEFDKCSKEAEMSFGRPEVFLERFLPKAMHIEIQVLGDGRKCVHLFERDCSVQLRKQKVVEIAPARGMNPQLRERIASSAVALCQSVGYSNAGTVEFLVEGELSDPNAGFYFLELNPRIQVEHTITEEITGVDLVQLQFKIAGGQSLNELVDQSKLGFQGFAIQIRVALLPGGGGKVLEYKEPKGTRVETSVSAGTVAVTDYDPMIAKLIVRGADFPAALAAASKAVNDYVVGGLKINTEFLNRILDHKEFVKGTVHTTWVEDQKLHLAPKKASGGAVSAGGIVQVDAPFPGQLMEVKVKVGDSVAAGDVLAVLSAMKMLNDIVADRPGKVVEILAEVNAQVNEGVPLLKMEATGDAPAMEEEVSLPKSARKTLAGSASPSRETGSWHTSGEAEEQFYNTPAIRTKIKPDDANVKKRHEHNVGVLAELHRRLAVVSKGGSERAVKLHRSRGKFLVRERVRKIIDKGTDFLELSALAGWEMYGGGIHSGGTITGIGLVAGREVMFIGTDATIKGGVNFPVGYKKWLRAQEIAESNHLPCVYLIDGGGAKLDGQGSIGKGGKSGRDMTYEGTLPAMFVEGGRQFYNQARMSAKGIPQVAVVCGMCTAGGAYTPAMSDETIIVKDNGTVYLGGPPLVKAATGEDADEQSLGGAVMHTTKSGTCDQLAPDEETALQMCREVIENLSGRAARTVLRNMVVPEAPLYDRESILGVIPESTNLPYDIREVIARIVDGSRFHEFKPKYGVTIVCGFAHIEGYPVGILANNGMLFSEAAIKATHFVQTCGKRGTPLVFLHNITGFIIGTAFEQGGITKDGAKMVNAISNVPVPKFSIVCGGSFGAGNYAMAGPAFGTRFTFLWPNAKISVMGGEQAAGVVAIVKQNALKRDGQQEMPEEMVNMLKKPIIDGIESCNSAYHSSAGAFDDGVIDPRDTRKVLAQAISISLNAPLPEGQYGVFRM